MAPGGRGVVEGIMDVLNELYWAEVGVPKLAPDARRVLVDERIRLEAALRSGDPERIREAEAEARRVARMWGLDV